MKILFFVFVLVFDSGKSMEWHGMISSTFQGELGVVHIRDLVPTEVNFIAIGFDVPYSTCFGFGCLRQLAESDQQTPQL